MKARRVFRHAAFVIIAIVLLVVVPVVTHFDIFGNDETDAVSSASIDLPAQPSGNFLVFMKTSKHAESLNEWKDFFNDDEFTVIFDDIRCLVTSGDVNGRQLAERFLGQLPENQMILREENPNLLASKVENGYIDVAIFSQEMAEALLLKTEGLSDITVFKITGGQ